MAMQQETTMGSHPGVTTRSMDHLASHDPIELIVREHRLVEALYDAYGKVNDPVKKRDFGYAMIKFLCLHAHKEELVLYPLLAHKTGNMQMMEHCLKEHQDVKLVLFQLDQLHTWDERFDMLVNQAMQDTLKHVREEEAEILPLLKSALSPEETVTLCNQWVSAASRAPTRPHPDAPNKLPAALEAYTAQRELDLAADTARFANIHIPMIDPGTTLSNPNLEHTIAKSSTGAV